MGQAERVIGLGWVQDQAIVLERVQERMMGLSAIKDRF